MKLFEYMGKELFRRYGIPVPRGKVAFTPEEAKATTEMIGSVVIKSQILSGKRGKAGGIKFPVTPQDAMEAAGQLIGQELRGYKVEALLVEEKLKIDQEIYLAIALDGTARSPVILASHEGGMDIEEVPEEKIVKRLVNVFIGVNPNIGREVAYGLGLTGVIAKQVADIVVKLYKMFTELDAELIEINPLVTSGEQVIAADAKITIDDESLNRHPDLPYVEERTALEKMAHDLGISYVELDGDIAIMANGAGITMATLDTIQYYGGRPANFLDAGGGANVEQNAKAIEIMLAAKPKAIILNIFGGITRCDDVANALVQVKQTHEINVPLVIRIAGTNEEEALKILSDNGLEAYRGMEEAARKVVELAKA
jgi:succinyl-CoA synthetase beta subunit